MSQNQVLQIAKLKRELFVPMVSISLAICLNRVPDFIANFDSDRDCTGARGDIPVWPDSRQKCGLWASSCRRDVFRFAGVGRIYQVCGAVNGLLSIMS